MGTLLNLIERVYPLTTKGTSTTEKLDEVLGTPSKLMLAGVGTPEISVLVTARPRALATTTSDTRNSRPASSNALASTPKRLSSRSSRWFVTTRWQRISAPPFEPGPPTPWRRCAGGGACDIDSMRPPCVLGWITLDTPGMPARRQNCNKIENPSTDPDC